MDNENKIEGSGSGITTRKFVNAVIEKRSAAFADELKAFGKMAPKKKVIEDLTAGFKDGARDMINALIESGVLKGLSDEEMDALMGACADHVKSNKDKVSP